MSLDFNTAEEQFDGVTSDYKPIPEGEIVDVLLTIQEPDQGSGVGPDGLLKQSQRSDAQYLSCEFTVTNGEYTRRKFWGNLTVSGGSLDEKGQSKAGQISARTIKAMLESCYNIQPTDMSDGAKSVRMLSSYMDLNNLLVKVTVGVETYNDKENNKLGKVIVPGMPEYKQPTGPDGFAKVKATSVSAQTDISSSQKTTNVKSDGGKPSWA